MWIVRPAQIEDVPSLAALCAAQGMPVSSLPRDTERLRARVEASRRAFAGEVSMQDARYLFVLEACDSGELVGAAGLDACAGQGQPFYSYRRDALIHASRELDVAQRVEVLYISHELSGSAVLCAFMMQAGLRGTLAMTLLSRARLLFIAAHRERFGEQLVVELQGVQGPAGAVPFWDSLGRHFFDMDFARADQLSGERSRTFIAELMPPHPIYVTLLDDPAQQALGQADPRVYDSLALLRAEGFRMGRHVDIFDGGPTLQAPIDALQTLRERRPGIPVGDQAALLGWGTGMDFRAGLRVPESVADVWHVPVQSASGDVAGRVST